MPIDDARRSGPLDAEGVRAFLDEAVIPLRLAAVAPSGWPVVVSLWFVRDGDTLVCATQESSPLVAALGMFASPDCPRLAKALTDAYARWKEPLTRAFAGQGLTTTRD